MGVWMNDLANVEIPELERELPHGTGFSFAFSILPNYAKFLLHILAPNSNRRWYFPHSQALQIRKCSVVLLNLLVITCSYLPISALESLLTWATFTALGLLSGPLMSLFTDFHTITRKTLPQWWSDCAHLFINFTINAAEAFSEFSTSPKSFYSLNLYLSI